MLLVSHFNYWAFPTVVPLFEAGSSRVTHPFATRSRKQALSRSFDLHVLGAPPAFVLSQDQTLYKWYLSLKSVKSCFAQHAIACVLCELLCLELFNVFFQHENRFRYKFFDIVQFSRSCAPQPCGWKLVYFITFAISCQALFWIIFEFHVEAHRFFTLGRFFWSVSFCQMSAWQ